MVWTALLFLMSQPAQACGGFFCGGTVTTSTTTTTTTTTETGSASYGLVPVVQGSERILFQVNPDDTVTTYVEVGYVQNEEVDFAWIIPIPDVIDASSVQAVSADMFNALETATAPRFTFTWTVYNYNYNYNYNYGYEYSYNYGYYGSSGSSGGCSGLGCTSDKSIADSAVSIPMDPTAGGSSGPTTSSASLGVEVVEDAVVGPFDIQVITATDAADFGTWLTNNGYELPDNATGPLQHYIDGGMAFLGVQLAPEVPSGPIDTLVFTYPSTEPMIPLILTAIASADDLPITAYILADQPHVPANWGVVPDFAQQTQPDGFGGTDYLTRATDAIDQLDGRGMVLEYASDTQDFPDMGLPAFQDLVEGRAWITRWRGDISPWQMTLDPAFTADDTLAAYSNLHTVDLGVLDPEDVPYDLVPLEDPGLEADPDGAALPLRWLLLLPLPLIGFLLRRRV